MQIVKLDHVNVRTTQLNDMINWYTTILDMRSGYRPYFPFPGAWMYAGESPVVHLVDIDGDPGIGAEVELKLEHFALTGSDLESFVAKLESMDEKYLRGEVADLNIIQINVWDPDGNHIHVDFSEDV